MQNLAVASKIFIVLFEKEPTKELFDAIVNDGFFDDFLIRQSRLKQALSEFKNAKSESYDEVAAEFTSLFISDIGGAKAPPFASYFFSDYAQSKSSLSLDIYKRFYEPYGYAKIYPIAYDALLNELGFVAFTLEKDELNLDKFKEFLSYEFLPFAQIFATLILKHSKSSFYKAVTLLFLDFLDELKFHFQITLQKREIFIEI